MVETLSLDNYSDCAPAQIIKNSIDNKFVKSCIAVPCKLFLRK